MSRTKSAEAPPMKTSEEAKKEGLCRAREEGKAYEQTVVYMINKVAEQGDQRPAGDYTVGYAVEKAEGLYRLRDGSLEWEEPEEDNIHVEVVVCDGADGRFVPGQRDEG